MVVVKEVKTKKEQKLFIEFPLKLYKDSIYFVPPLYADEKALFKKDYVYYETADAVYYLAYIDNKVVGRISGIISHGGNERWNQKRVRFTRFDSIDNQEVANALFSAVVKWGKTNGMNILCGPLGFSDLEREGLLIEGFDELATFEEQYNYSYYQRLIENFGLVKEVDWEERKIYSSNNFDVRLEKLTQSILKKYNLHIPKCKNVNDFLRRYADQFFELYEEAYDDLYQTVPLTDGMKKMLISNFKTLLTLDYIAVVVDENDKVVCLGLILPSLAKAVQPSGGRLTLPTFFRILKAVKKPEIVDLALVGVDPKYAMKGVVTALFVELNKVLKRPGISHAETNLNLENNIAIINQWKKYESVYHKRRRSYIKHI
jgi:hypothetical protein